MSSHLELPSQWCVHAMFHSSQLKPAAGYDGSNANAADVPAFRPAADELGKYKIEDILDHRSRGHGRLSCMEYLVKWQGYSVFELMWEPEGYLTNCACTLALYYQHRGLH